MLGICLALIDSAENQNRFVELYERYSKLMFYIAKQILKDKMLSEDAVQEAFLRIAKNFNKIIDIECPQTRSFVVIITRNVALSILSKVDNNTIYDDNLGGTIITDDVYTSKELLDAIFSLPTNHRDVMYLYYIYGYNMRECASLLGLSTETVKKRIQRARKKLIDILEMEG